MFGKNRFLSIKILMRLLTMKLAIRIIAFAFVLAGGAAASVSSTTTMRAIPSHQSAASALPVPICGPDIPCPPDQPLGK